MWYTLTSADYRWQINLEIILLGLGLNADQRTTVIGAIIVSHRPSFLSRDHAIASSSEAVANDSI